jgi:hypothetical protein
MAMNDGCVTAVVAGTTEAVALYRSLADETRLRMVLTRPELIDLLRAAEGVLAATGAAVALCPTSDTATAAAVTR